MIVLRFAWAGRGGAAFLAAALIAAAAVWAASGGAGASGAFAPGAGDGETPALPGAHDVESPDSITLQIPAGMSLVGWFGVPTSSATILANNAGIESVFRFEAGVFQSDSAGLPDALRAPFNVDRGDGLFLSAPAATTLTVPMRVAQTADITFLDAAPGEPSPDMGMPTGGTATLTRTAGDIQLEISAASLTPGDAYSVWWVIFNDWQQCTDGECGLDDVVAAVGGDTTAGVSVLHASGAVPEDDGTAAMTARLVVGDPGQHQVLFGDGLTSIMDTEIHFVIRTHGPASADADELAQQLSTFEFGCTEDSSLGLGSGDFGCFDAQDAIFAAPGR